MSRKCNRCGNEVIASDTEGYAYQCEVCDEDLHSFETYEFDMKDEVRAFLNQYDNIEGYWPMILEDNKIDLNEFLNQIQEYEMFDYEDGHDNKVFGEFDYDWMFQAVEEFLGKALPDKREFRFPESFIGYNHMALFGVLITIAFDFQSHAYRLH